MNIPTSNALYWIVGMDHLKSHLHRSRKNLVLHTLNYILCVMDSKLHHAQEQYVQRKQSNDVAFLGGDHHRGDHVLVAHHHICLDPGIYYHGESPLVVDSGYTTDRGSDPGANLLVSDSD